MDLSSTSCRWAASCLTCCSRDFDLCLSCDQTGLLSTINFHLFPRTSVFSPFGPLDASFQLLLALIWPWNFTFYIFFCQNSILQFAYVAPLCQCRFDILASITWSCTPLSSPPLSSTSLAGEMPGLSKILRFIVSNKPSPLWFWSQVGFSLHLSPREPLGAISATSPVPLSSPLLASLAKLPLASSSSTPARYQKFWPTLLLVFDVLCDTFWHSGDPRVWGYIEAFYQIFLPIVASALANK